MPTEIQCGGEKMEQTQVSSCKFLNTKFFQRVMYYIFYT